MEVGDLIIVGGIPGIMVRTSGERYYVKYPTNEMCQKALEKVKDSWTVGCPVESIVYDKTIIFYDRWAQNNKGKYIIKKVKKDEL